MNKTQSTITAYNHNVNAYSAKFMDYEPYSNHVIEFAKIIDADAKVLDIGCGPGNVAKQLFAAKPMQITGVDLSEEMVKLARSNVPAGDFYTQDIRKLDFPRDHFNAIVMSFCIVHLSDEESYRLLANAINWLYPGGILYLSFMEGKKAGFETTSFSEEPIYFNYFKGNVIEKFLVSNGITILQMVRQNYNELDGSVTTDIFIFGKKD
ncbi:class I SAM-dependent methyltransferase [Anaerosporomusa subterranea]|uniref:class I SAM-dependent methyltransferase n=1 Tax=Anaerosporomusa subterranea TaxID=1794912 RepID=UPI00094207F3|nr:class I SAM-dependent methyltransferase [Anaerosporomusa subterranea]